MFLFVVVKIFRAVARHSGTDVLGARDFFGIKVLLLVDQIFPYTSENDKKEG
jgi:hypothetical protein